MMEMQTVLALLGDMREAELVSWVERGWVQPDSAGTSWEFHEIDVARVRLIRELREDVAVNDEAMPVVLSLLDQVYDLRCALRRVSDALRRQPADVREAVLKAL